MKKSIRRAAVLLAVAAATGVNAQEQKDTLSSQPAGQEQGVNQFTLDASLLTRGELRRGGLPSDKQDKNENEADFVVDRARLTLGYQSDRLTNRKAELSVNLTIQHEGVWGMENGGDFNIYEAWAQVKAKNGLFARIGRQELVYDDERILGNDDWAMAALSHDGLKLGYEGHGHKAHAFVAYNQNGKNVNGGTYYTDGYQPYKTMQTLWYHYDAKRLPLGVSLLFMNVGMQSGTEDDYHTAYQQLWGGYLTVNPKPLLLEASYYRQTGKSSLEYKSGHELPLKSWMAAVKATYEFNPKFSAYAGYDYLSGDKEFVVPGPGHIGLTQHTEITAFTPVFGENHKFYGAMDFFYVSAYFGTNSPGLQNLYGGATIKPVKNLTLDAAYHYVAIATDLNLNKSLGHEMEVSATWKPMKDVKIAAGYSFMAGTETMELLKRSTNKRKMHWAWLMFTVSPRIFSAKW